VSIVITHDLDDSVGESNLDPVRDFCWVHVGRVCT
jgi:hypothetical protein